MLFLRWGFLSKVSIILHGVGFSLSFVSCRCWLYVGFSLSGLFYMALWVFNGDDGLLVDIRE